RFVSVLVFVPRERFDNNLRKAVGEQLAEAFNGRVSAYYQYFPDGPLMRVHYIIGRDSGTTPNPDQANLEAAVVAIVRSWNDTLQGALDDAHEQNKARALIARSRHAFAEGYRAAYTPQEAVADIRVIERLSPERPIDVEFYPRGADGGQCVGLKVWS